MGTDSSHFHDRATHCRRLAKDTLDAEAERTLNKMAEDLESEADRLDAEEPVERAGVDPQRMHPD